MSKLYGVANRISQEIGAVLVNNSDFNKLLYYKHIKDKDIFEQPDLDDAVEMLIGKQVFFNRRIPKLLRESDICITINTNDITNTFTKTRSIKRVLIDILIIGHDDCLDTIHGQREVALLCAIQEILEEQTLGGIGKCKLLRVNPLVNIPTEFSGYSTVVEVTAFDNAII